MPHKRRGRPAHRGELSQPEEERSEVVEVAVTSAEGGQGESGQVVHEHVATRTAQLGHPQCEEHLRARTRGLRSQVGLHGHLGLRGDRDAADHLVGLKGHHGVCESSALRAVASDVVRHTRLVVEVGGRQP